MPQVGKLRRSVHPISISISIGKKDRPVS